MSELAREYQSGARRRPNEVVEEQFQFRAAPPNAELAVRHQMSLPQLKNMVLAAEAGAMIMPARPAFYQMPKTLDDLADFMAGKILAALGIEHALYPEWKPNDET